MSLRGDAVEIEVEFEDVDAGFAEEAKLAALGVLLDEAADGVGGQVALAGDAVELEAGLRPG